MVTILAAASAWIGAKLTERAIIGPTTDRRCKIKALANHHQKQEGVWAAPKTLGEFKNARSSRRRTLEAMFRVRRGEFDSQSFDDVKNMVNKHLQPSATCSRPPLHTIGTYSAREDQDADWDDCRCPTCTETDDQPVIIAGDKVDFGIPPSIVPHVPSIWSFVDDADPPAHDAMLVVDHAVVLARLSA